MMKFDTEDAKKLHVNRQDLYDASEKYRISFQDPISGLIRDEFLEYRRCPACNSDNERELFHKYGGRYVVCSSCEMIYVNPVFKDHALEYYYQNNHSMQAYSHDSETDFYKQIYTSGVSQVVQIIPSGKLLDIGCSGGFFLDLARAAGFDTFGVELNQVELDIARRRGHKVWGVPIQEIPDTEKFDVICLWDVFEHIKDGIDYLSYLHSKQSGGGIIFLQIPNANSLAARIMQQKCNMFDGIEHVNLYAPQTLKAVAGKAGYRINLIRSVIDELKPLSNYLNYEDPYSGRFNPTSFSPFVDREKLHDMLMGYKLQAVLSVNR